ncbi:hypothetical protein BGZ82_005114 [Podila clonocystis]|nr:hypothetical protein BGZ82_005114 [Podila clonocystis]
MASNSSTYQNIPDIRTFRYRSSRWPGRLMIISGFTHTGYALRTAGLREPFLAAIRDGYVDQFKENTARGNSFWFILTGATIVLIGQLMNWYLFPEPRNAILEKGSDKKKSKAVKQDPWKERLIGATVNQQVSQFVLPRKMGVWLVGLWIVGAAAYPVSGFYLFAIQGLAILLTK